MKRNSRVELRLLGCDEGAHNEQSTGNHSSSQYLLYGQFSERQSGYSLLQPTIDRRFVLGNVVPKFGNPPKERDRATQDEEGRNETDARFSTTISKQTCDQPGPSKLLCAIVLEPQNFLGR